MLNKGLYESSRWDWGTPKKLFLKLDEEFGFTLDVCASYKNRKCENYFDKDQNGLAQKWEGNVWMNPPYGREIAHWVRKAYVEGLREATVVCLLPVRSDTRWWHLHVMKAAEIRLLTRRLSFEGSTNKAPFPAAIVIFDRSKNRQLPIVSSYSV